MEKCAAAGNRTRVRGCFPPLGRSMGSPCHTAGPQPHVRLFIYVYLSLVRSSRRRDGHALQRRNSGRSGPQPHVGLLIYYFCCNNGSINISFMVRNDSSKWQTYLFFMFKILPPNYSSFRFISAFTVSSFKNVILKPNSFSSLIAL